MKLRKITARTLFGLATLITLVALAWTIVNWNGARAWQQEQARLRSRNQPLSWDSLRPKPVPDADNFATTPLFAQVFTYARTTNESGRPAQRWTGGDALGKVSQSLALPHKSPAKPRVPPDGRRIDLDDLAADLVAPGDKSGVDAVLAALDARQDVMRELEAAAARPGCRFPLRYEDSYQMLLPHLALLRSASLLFRVRATARLAKQDIAGALRDLETQLRLADAAGSDPILISRLVGERLERQAIAVAWQGWLEQRWNAADYERLTRLFAGRQPRPRMIDALRGEWIGATSFVDLLVEDRARHIAALELPDNPGLGLTVRWMPRGWLRRNQVVMSRWIDGFVQAAEAVPPDQGISNLNTPPPPKSRAPGQILASILIPALPNALQKTDRLTVDLLLLRTACALERHRHAHGSFPRSLDALVPAFLEAVPKDPFTGKPLGYTPTPDGRFTLYSVGSDGTDDGGTPSPGEGKKPGDWVWSTNPECQF